MSPIDMFGIPILIAAFLAWICLTIHIRRSNACIAKSKEEFAANQVRLINEYRSYIDALERENRALTELSKTQRETIDRMLKQPQIGEWR